jgi:phosphopantetheinyl transferase
METIQYTRIGPLAQFVKFSLLLSAERREKMYSYRKQEDRLRCLAGGLLLERVFGCKKLHYTEYGKPFLSEGPFFNLSHSGEVVCIGVSASSPIGIDIEEWQNDDLEALAKTAFHPAEQAFFFENPAIRRFYEIWTLKESYIKMIGTGFSLDSKEFCILPWAGSARETGRAVKEIPDQFPCLQKNRFRPDGHTCFFRKFDLIEGYSLSLCTEKPLEITTEEIVFTFA